MSTNHRDPFHGHPGSWVCGCIYFRKDDPRVIVPKRLRGFGWTLNFARPAAFPVLLLLVAAATLPCEALRFLHYSSPAAWFVTRALVVAGVIWVCVRVSLPPGR